MVLTDKNKDTITDPALKELNLSFNQKTRSLNNTVWIDVGKEKDWVPVTIPL